MPQRNLRSGPKGQPTPESSPDAHPIDDSTQSPTGSDETDLDPWKTHNPVEKMLEEITNNEHDRFKTPSPKTTGEPSMPPPQVKQRPRRDSGRRRTRFSYSSDIEMSSDEAKRIRESSRENGRYLFEHFNQTYVARDDISLGRSRAFKRARRVLDSPFLEPTSFSTSAVQDQVSTPQLDYVRFEGNDDVGTSASTCDDQ